MPFYLSPQVAIIEKDATLTIPGVSTSVGAFVGDFEWGPVSKAILLSTVDNLIANFGKPTDRNHKDWFTAYNFLSYSNAIRVARAINDTLETVTVTADGTADIDLTPYSAEITVPTSPTQSGDYRVYNVTQGTQESIGGTTTDGKISLVVAPNAGDILFVEYGFGNMPENARDITTGVQAWRTIKNADDWAIKEATIESYTNAKIIAKYPGQFGNRLSVAYRDGKDSRSFTLTDLTFTAATSDISTAGGNFLDLGITVGQSITVSGTASNDGVYTVAAVTASTITVNEAVTDEGTGNVTATFTYADKWVDWAFASLFDYKPEQSTSSDEFAVVVLLDGEVVERFIVDAVSGRKDGNNNSNYFKTVIATQSRYIWATDHILVNAGATTFTAGTSDIWSGDKLADAGEEILLAGGTDGSDLEIGDYTLTWSNVFGNAEETDISLCMQGGAPSTVGKYIIEQICGTRLDSVAFVSPAYSDVVGTAQPTTNIINRRNTDYNISGRIGSYGFMDGNYKYQYDPYNEVYRWVPLNGDIAGLAAWTDNQRDPWWAFSGFNRGQIKNVVKLAYSPNKAQRDDLYQANVNPVITTRGEGNILYGDKTLLSRPSAFNRINVRRLFIVLEKAIATAAKYQLFEFNDEVTRTRFVQMVEPFLRDVKGRRGIIDFDVIADERVNTPEVIDRSEFKASILIKPNRVINFIELTFTAVKTGVQFDEVQL